MYISSMLEAHCVRREHLRLALTSTYRSSPVRWGGHALQIRAGEWLPLTSYKPWEYGWIERLSMGNTYDSARNDTRTPFPRSWSPSPRIALITRPPWNLCYHVARNIVAREIKATDDYAPRQNWIYSEISAERLDQCCIPRGEGT